MPFAFVCIVALRMEQLCTQMRILRKCLVLGRWDVVVEDKHQKGTEYALLLKNKSCHLAFLNCEWEWGIGGDRGAARVLLLSSHAFCFIALLMPSLPSPYLHLLPPPTSFLLHLPFSPLLSLTPNPPSSLLSLPSSLLPPHFFILFVFIRLLFVFV